MERLIIGASIGNCVHVAGVLNFLRLAEEHGYNTKFLGPAVSIDYLLDAVQESNPEMVAVGYRLTPETGYNLFKRLKESVIERGLTGYKFVFGGTLPVAREARKVGLFDAIFSGEEELEEIIAFLEGREFKSEDINFGENLLERIEIKKPYPVIRHHFGLPSVEKTREGIKKISESKVLDVISLGPDQNAQESFFRPEEMDEDEKGAGGVPVRTEQDLISLYEATRRGNYPLMRCYSGTRDVFKMAEMLLRTIHNAWAAIPLSWYNRLDGRGPRGLLESIRENQQLMKWHGVRDIPVEVNESHHWSLRDAHDTVAVVMAFLAAYNAKQMGVKNYIAQYMFNNPAGTTASMDLAKMLAKKELIESLVDDKFRVLTQVRAGLASFPPNLDRAKGQLAYSTYLGMALKPDIVHVVGYSEADHAATSSDVIESCQIARQVINNSIYGYPGIGYDPDIKKRKDELLKEAEILLNAIKNVANNDVEDPWSDPETLARSIKIGLIDAPHLKGNPEAAGKLTTRMVNGACYAYDYNEDRIITEEERIQRLGG
ncbi:cobalamin-dependent protein [Halothermothrix orenii]|uniref:Cobalamin B12-binding domain protein n=1 Tax=Halothermothrix orenii (strain H 168 / OCM 544 / DSM 9562) TaxID=373903 RepID=B8CWR2_HALOH|nr:cobalamin-dependent protein [Halothermothrix orenii]ACL69731.1 cobalamin B12-binding domain protein [Halothermothrix orenii H 168]